MTQTLRRGDSTDPYQKITNESHVITNNYIILKEKPYKNDHISISGYCETMSPTPDGNMFVVDYYLGVVIFNPSENGKTVLVNYTGTGTNFLDTTFNLDSEMQNARGGFANLDTRLDAFDAHLTESAYYVKNYGLKGDGITDDSTALNSLTTTIGSNKADIYFSKGTYLLNSNISIPSNINVRFANGAILKSSTATINIAGYIYAAPTQKLFDLTGTAIITGIMNDTIYPEWWGATPYYLDNTFDNTKAFNDCVACCLQGDGNFKVFQFGQNETYKINGTIKIVKRLTNANAPDPIFRMKGICGGSQSPWVRGETTIMKTTPGNIIQFNEEDDGSFPGGGAGVVTLPLQYLRRIHLSDFNLLGDRFNPLNVNGFMSRNTFKSYFERMGLQALNIGIKCGSEGTMEKSADGYDLDYCERNEFKHITTYNVETHYIVSGGDITRWQQCNFYSCPDANGRLAYISLGNDTYEFDNCIFQPYIKDDPGYAPINKAIETYFINTIKFQSCHIEHLSKYFVQGSLEVFDAQDSLFYATSDLQAVACFSLSFTHGYGLLNFENNTVHMNQPTDQFFYLLGQYQLATVNVRNNSVKDWNNNTFLLKNSVDFGAPYSWKNPLKMNTGYVWFDGKNFLRTQLSKPTTDTQGYVASQFVGVPVSKTATGYAGQWSADANYVYLCYSDNNWIRIAKDGTW